MAFLISIIGNTGVGKTSLANALVEKSGWELIPEQHEERPYQAAASSGISNAIFPNQIDYLLYRAEQEKAMRPTKGIYIQDGGLDLDFHLFTKMFYHNGLIDEDQFRLCDRLYHFIRNSLPCPDLLVYLTAPLETIRQRKESRNRLLDVSTTEDIEIGQDLLNSWLGTGQDEKIMTIDAENASLDYHSQALIIMQTAISMVVNE